MSHTIVIFGASGDLTSRKLVPALFQLYLKERLPEQTRIIGVARREMTEQQWRDRLADTMFDGEADDRWGEFAERLIYHQGDISDADSMRELAGWLDGLDGGNDERTRIYYLSIAPRLYESAVENLGAAGLASEEQGPSRVVIEKPFGSDLESARRLNEAVHQVFDEKQIYRIDHYLGKETVQNVLVLRLANTIFEPIWNRNYIDNVQITAAEEVGVETRAGYYDGVGVLRDMFQNHLLQLLMLTAMEPPVRFEADAVRNEKVKVLEAIRVMKPEEVARASVRAQYEGYRSEEGVAADSQTATFAAVRFCVENWRWRHVPFLLRSGKAMSCRTTQIVIQFRRPPHIMFDVDPVRQIQANRLVIQVQPAEGVFFSLQQKVPDQGMKLREMNLSFRFDEAFDGRMPEAYERLLLDAITGDASLFARSDEVEMAWRIIDPIQKAWDSGQGPELATYPIGEWGPHDESARLIGEDRQWFDVCPRVK